MLGKNNTEAYLKQLLKNSKKLPDTVQVSFKELFSESFMLKHTTFSSLSELISAGGFTADIFDSLPDAAFDKYISEHSKFKDWNAMYDKARDEYIAKRLNV